MTQSWMSLHITAATVRRRLKDLAERKIISGLGMKRAAGPRPREWARTARRAESDLKCGQEMEADID